MSTVRAALTVLRLLQESPASALLRTDTAPRDGMITMAGSLFS
ncbi:hypothetical protein [Zhihengliuella flava]|uniref:Uncharacterized protein n=1 Tax=Zhihengliuella flava TaxID=1285193 RepID=A0A931GLG8_9MICC|nr:hypothetical protein [Zhihengliuella flava]MBG6084439.1 hypothetical protein [Zhihengliuella flava]